MSIRNQLGGFLSDRQSGHNYYQLLDISQDERDTQVIEEAALRCSGHVRAYQLACEAESTVRLNEIAQAMVTLLDPVQRREYDLHLARSQSPPLPDPLPPAGHDSPGIFPGKSAPRTPPASTHLSLIGRGGACDVKLVYRQRAS